MTPLKIQIELVNGDSSTLPDRSTPGSSGYDVCSRIGMMIQPGSFALVPTGIKIAVPPGYEAQVRPRSGLAAKKGITVLNGPGTIDSDYRGEVGIILINLGRDPFILEPGMRIAQLIFAKVESAEFIKVECLEESKRGEGGFGSTGQ